MPWVIQENEPAISGSLHPPQAARVHSSIHDTIAANASRRILTPGRGHGRDARVVDWPKAFQQAESLARRFSPTLRPGGHDLVLVAATARMGGTWFLSFDRQSRQRSLAAAAGLRVWPPLDKAEKCLAKHASQQAAG